MKPRFTPQDKEVREKFSTNLKALMNSHNYTQKYVSKYTNIARSTISDYYNGHTVPSNENLEKLAHFFNVRPEELDPRFSTSTTQGGIHYPKKVDIKELKDKHVAMSYGGIDLTKDDFKILEAILKRNELLKDE